VHIWLEVHGGESGKKQVVSTI